MPSVYLPTAVMLHSLTSSSSDKRCLVSPIWYPAASSPTMSAWVIIIRTSSCPTKPFAVFFPPFHLLFQTWQQCKLRKALLIQEQISISQYATWFFLRNINLEYRRYAYHTCEWCRIAGMLCSFLLPFAKDSLSRISCWWCLSSHGPACRPERVS